MYEKKYIVQYKRKKPKMKSTSFSNENVAKSFKESLMKRGYKVRMIKQASFKLSPKGKFNLSNVYYKLAKRGNKGKGA